MPLVGLRQGRLRPQSGGHSSTRCGASLGQGELLRERVRRLEEARINPAVRGRGGIADLHPVLIPRGDAELETLFRHLHRLR